MPSTLNEIVAQFGSDEQRDAVQIRAFRIIRDRSIEHGDVHTLMPSVRTPDAEKLAGTLEHDRQKECDKDPARRYLKGRGTRPFKSSESLLNHIRRNWARLKAWRASQPPVSMADLLDSADQFIERAKRKSNGREVYDLPMPVLDAIVELRRKAKRIWWHKNRKK